jgi:UrcA family protein
MNTNLRTRLTAALCCAWATAALCSLSTSSQASDQDVPAKTVRYPDLDIQTRAGAKILYSRIRAAARDVCNLSVPGDPILQSAVHTCMDTAIDRAVRKVNAPYLTTLRFGSDVRLASK